MALKRIMKELRDMQQDGKGLPFGAVIKPAADSVFHLKLTFAPPHREDQLLEFDIQIPSDYPFKPPNVTYAADSVAAGRCRLACPEMACWNPAGGSLRLAHGGPTDTSNYMPAWSPAVTLAKLAAHICSRFGTMTLAEAVAPLPCATESHS